jgi:hypothetical protein
MKRFSAFVATALLALCFGAGQALAAEGDTSAPQATGQSASSGQGADAGGGAFQAGPTNSASSIRVLSPGDDGDVSQSNSSTAGATALNGNTTDQSVDQTQAGGGYGSDQAQIAGQSADNHQWADADATAKQIEPQNDSLSIRVLSPGDNGDVTQSNSASAGALAANGNSTDQSVDQTQAGGGWGSDSTQIAGQSADNDQRADADATAVQVKPENTASSIRVLSPGDDGNVTQSNDATALGAALNGNETTQSIDQTQGGLTKRMPEATTNHVVYPPASSSTQIAGQSASNHQWADADATAVQVKPENTASSIRVLSPGDDGNVTQSNDAIAVGIAANTNKTGQSIGQSQGGGFGSDSLQVAGQGAWSKQSANADATAVQLGATNEVAPVRVLSPDSKGKDAKDGKGDKRDKGHGGSVEQSNQVGAVALALNLNATCQSLVQSQTGHGSSGLQVGGQGAWSTQYGSADAFGLQGVMPKQK